MANKEQAAVRDLLLAMVAGEWPANTLSCAVMCWLCGLWCVEKGRGRECDEVCERES